MRVVATASPGGPEALQVREVEDLPTPGEGEVLVGVAAAGVNRGDKVQRQGQYLPPAGASPYPGLKCSGTIVALGANAPRAGPSIPGVRAAYRRRVCGEGGGSGGAAAPGDGGGVAD